MSTPPRARRVLMTLDAVGGVWRYAMDLATGLSHRGIGVTFACFGPPARAHQIAEAKAIGAYVHADAPLDWTARSGTELRGVAGRLVAIARDVEADLLHLNLPSQASGLRIDLPLVVVSHSCIATWFRAVRDEAPPSGWQWHEALNRQGLLAAGVVLAPSRSHADMLEACYGRLPQLRVVHNAVRPIIPSAEKEPFILAAGRWWDDGKNAALLDAAAARTYWPVRLAGRLEGPNGERRGIEFAEPMGEVPNSELRELMSRAAIFASPSIYEPFGLAPLEAASAGAALVLTDIPTYRELWDGAALLVTPDPEAFSAALNRLAKDEALRRELGAEAARRAMRFTIGAQADAVLTAYAEAERVHFGKRELVA